MEKLLGIFAASGSSSSSSEEAESELGARPAALRSIGLKHGSLLMTSFLVASVLRRRTLLFSETETVVEQRGLKFLRLLRLGGSIVSASDSEELAFEPSGNGRISNSESDVWSFWGSGTKIQGLVSGACGRERRAGINIQLPDRAKTSPAGTKINSLKHRN